MDIRLNGRVALVTGGSQGIGYATALRFALSGADVAILARDAAKLETARRKIAEASGRQIEAVVCDVSKASDIIHAMDALSGRLGPVDILFNNAGGHASGAFAEIDDDRWQADIDVKLFNMIRFCRLVMPGMQERGWGRIINILNIYARAPAPGTAPTAVTRAAQLALTKLLSGEGAHHNVLVNGIVIGLVRSEQFTRLYGGDESPEDGVAAVVQQRGIPMGRVGEVEEVANVACFLASDAASYVTGAVINVDGGLSPAA